MIRKFGLGMAGLLILFLGYASTRESKFRYERSGLIDAPANKVFPYISQFRLGSTWNPYAMKDPNMKTVFLGTEGQVGSSMEFDGNQEAGKGRLEVTRIVPNESVEIKLTMTKPIKAENTILYKLTAEGTRTRFSWTISGDGGFIGKVISIFIDCEKMMAEEFVKGISNLKRIVETQS